MNKYKTILQNVFSICCSAEVSKFSESYGNIKYSCTKCDKTFNTVTEDPHTMTFICEVRRDPTNCCNSGTEAYSKGDPILKKYNRFGIVQIPNSDRYLVHICKNCKMVLRSRKWN
jgi:hypothetical protein